MQYLNVREEESLLDEMLALNGGVRRVPVIVIGEKITVGFGGS